MKFLNDIKNSNNSILNIKKLGFEITNEDLPLEIGETNFDPDAKTLITRITENDFLRHGQQQIIRVRNTTGTTILKGRAVYVTGGISASPILLIDLANNNDIGQARRFIGLTTTEILNNEFGNVVTSGVIEGIDLPSENFSVGDCAYITTNGEYSNIKPEKGLVTIRVGMIIRVSNNNGAILVFSRFQPFIGMLSDVSITDPQSGDLIVYDADLGIWVSQQPSAIDSLEALKVSYDNVDFGGIQTNVQDAIEQLFFMFNSVDISYDGGFSSSTYNESLNVNGGNSVAPLTGVKQINGGES